jgi:DNA-binding ferritin-like protein
MQSTFYATFTSYFAFLGASQLAHWNIVGENFYQLHLLFQRVYETLSSHGDSLAEQARGEKIEIPAKVFNEVPDIEWTDGEDLVEWLIGLLMRYKSDLELLRDTCEQSKNYGFVNVIEGFLTDCNIIKYLLTSALEE